MLVGIFDSKFRFMDCQNGVCLRVYFDLNWKNEGFCLQLMFGGKEKYVFVGDEMVGSEVSVVGEGCFWVWDILMGKVVVKISIFWGLFGYE